MEYQLMRIFWLLRTAIITIKPQMKKKLKNFQARNKKEQQLLRG